MTLSDFRRITDELLSAYIDDEVTEQERALVEAAIAQDEEIAWRLNALRQTVTLLRDLPELALPRSFTLTFDQVAQANDQRVGVGAMREEAMATPAAPPRLQRQVAPTPQAGFWAQVVEGWRKFWQGGNPMLRNAAAVSFALMLFLAGGGQLLNRALTQPAGMMATAPEAPAAAPAASEAMPQTQAVAIAPTATEATAAESTSLQVQEDASLKTPVEDAPAEESARIMQAPAESTSDASPATTEAASAARASSESGVAESADTEESAEADAAVQAGEAAVAEAAAAPASDAPAPTTTVEEPAVAAAMAAPEQPQGGEMPPLVANPLPDGGLGGRPQSGGGMGGGGTEGPVGGGGETGDLVPEEAHAFDVNPIGAPTPLPAEEGVTASVAAAPAAEAPAASAADVAVTPAVDEVAPEAEEEAESEAVTTDIPVTATSAPTVQAVAEATEEATAEATPEAVALVAPGAITNSEIVENVESEGATPAPGPAGTVPVVWVAQGSAFLLTIVLASLWWRSRTPRRPRGS